MHNVHPAAHILQPFRGSLHSIGILIDADDTPFRLQKFRDTV